MKRLKRLSLFIALSILCTMLTGCWDKIEIEERLFVLGIGVDKATQEEKNQPNDKYLISFSSPIVSALKDGGDKVFDTYKTVGELFATCLTQMSSRFSGKLFFGHTTVLIYGEDILKDEKLFREALDAMSRGDEFHQSMYAFVTPDRAEEVFKVKPKYSKLLAMYITGIADNDLYVDRVSKMSAHEMYNRLLNQDGDIMLPKLTATKDEVKITGAAVVKDYKLIGYVSEEETIYSSWVKDQSEGGLVTAKYMGITVPYSYNEFKRSITLDKVEEDKIYLTYNMQTEGSVDEYIWSKDLLRNDILDGIEKAVEQEIIKHSNEIIKKFKEDFQVDLVGAREYLQKFHPDIYKTIKNNYDEQFKSNIIINVNAEVKIRRVGVTE